MSERLRSDGTRYRYNTNFSKMPENDLGPRKTLFIIVIVVGCFAVLWPKVFYPMLMGPTQKPGDLEQGCCDVFSETDVNTVKFLSELCNVITQHPKEKQPLQNREIISNCRAEILNKCGIDISPILQEKINFGRTIKQILDKIRSLNGSLCLKNHFGISPWILGVPHKIVVNYSIPSIKQERPAYLRPEMLHPALRERGRAIPPSSPPSRKTTTPKISEGRPGPVPGLRPPMGGAGHVVPPSQKGNSMSVIMPIYTIGIVVFFMYTLMKVILKKKPEPPGFGLYPPLEPDKKFRKEVFETKRNQIPSKFYGGSGKLVVNAMSALLDEVDQELESRWKSYEVENQNFSSCDSLPNSKQDQTSVKILGMEMTASCEGGQKWSRPDSPILPTSSPPIKEEELPQAIYLEGALPAQSQLLVSDAKVETEPTSDTSTDPAIVLASKMTLSVISMDPLPEMEIGTTNGNGKEKEEFKLIDNSLTDFLRNESEQAYYNDLENITANALTNAENEFSQGELSNKDMDLVVNDEQMNNDHHKYSEAIDIKAISEKISENFTNEDTQITQLIDDQSETRSTINELVNTDKSDASGKSVENESKIIDQQPSFEQISEEIVNNKTINQGSLNEIVDEQPVIYENVCEKSDNHINNEQFSVDGIVSEEAAASKTVIEEVPLTYKKSVLDSTVNEQLPVSEVDEQLFAYKVPSDSCVTEKNADKIIEVDEHFSDKLLQNNVVETEKNDTNSNENVINLTDVKENPNNITLESDGQEQLAAGYNQTEINKKIDFPQTYSSTVEDDELFSKMYIAHAGTDKFQNYSSNSIANKQTDLPPGEQELNINKFEEKNKDTQKIETFKTKEIISDEQQQLEVDTERNENETIKENYSESTHFNEAEPDSILSTEENVSEASGSKHKHSKQNEREDGKEEQQNLNTQESFGEEESNNLHVERVLGNSNNLLEDEFQEKHLISLEAAKVLTKNTDDSQELTKEEEKVTDLDDEDIPNFDFNRELERIKNEISEYTTDENDSGKDVDAKSTNESI